MSAHSSRLLTEAVVATLEAVDLLVGTGIKPAGGGWQGDPGGSQYNPYVVVYPTPGGTSDGSLGVPFDDVSPDFIVSSFGSTVAQAQWGDDAVRNALTAPGAVTLAGRVVMLMIPDVEGGAVRDDDVQPPLWHAPTRWRAMTTAA